VRRRPYPCPNSSSYARTNSGPDPLTDSNPGTHAHSDPEAHSNADAHAHSNTDADSYPYPNTGAIGRPLDSRGTHTGRCCKRAREPTAPGNGGRD
jgi:hypothetical protein